MSRVRSHHMSLPKLHSFKCDEYGYIVKDCQYQMPPSGTPAHHHRQNSRTRHHTRSTSRCHHWDRYRHNRSMSQSQPHRYRSHSDYDSHRGCSRSHYRLSGCHHRSTSHHHHSTHCLCCNTPHWRSSSHRSSLTHFRDHSRSSPHTAYKPSKKILFKSSSSSGKTPVKPQDRKHHRGMIDDPQTDYYSSDDTWQDTSKTTG